MFQQDRANGQSLLPYRTFAEAFAKAAVAADNTNGVLSRWARHVQFLKAAISSDTNTQPAKQGRVRETSGNLEPPARRTAIRRSARDAEAGSDGSLVANLLFALLHATPIHKVWSDASKKAEPLNKASGNIRSAASLFFPVSTRCGGKGRSRHCVNSRLVTGQAPWGQASNQAAR
jgi:hypothetical protein